MDQQMEREEKRGPMEREAGEKKTAWKSRNGTGKPGKA